MSLSAPPSTGQRPNGTVDAIVVVHNGACVAGAVSRRPGRPDTAASAARHRRRREQRHVERHRARPLRRAPGDPVRRDRASRRPRADRARHRVRHRRTPRRRRRLVEPGCGCCTTTPCRAPTRWRNLLQAGLRSKSVGVAGPKIVAWDDPRRLVEMGIQITRTGRRLASPARGEADQGQYDHRADVLAVSTSGMLVRRSAYDDIGGFDPAFVEHGADLDFGWRAQARRSPRHRRAGSGRARRVRRHRRGAARRPPAARARAPRPPSRQTGHAGAVLTAGRAVPGRLDGPVRLRLVADAARGQTAEAGLARA